MYLFIYLFLEHAQLALDSESSLNLFICSATPTLL